MDIFESVYNLLGITSTSKGVINFSCSTMELLGWGTACVSLTGAFLNARRKWYSFFVWMVANVSWIIYDVYNGCYAQAALFFAYLSMNMYGIYCWKFKGLLDAVKEKAEEELDSYADKSLT